MKSMKDIKINRYPHLELDLYRYDESLDEFLFVDKLNNDYEFLDVRVQIKENKLKNYAIKIKDYGFIIIDQDGRLSEWPDVLCIADNLMIRLL